ncbi:hypothetical protein K450DRAFT_262001 [Umbelopsis ramanniana AG]|uniref:Uncharacterized protein n=1 Tax=Umbelopsis ramanniana AG TaxID=1314678 RepID=A0AAD5HAQ1_UMBRA|nr:uncharacterized protein K450DRAFT_262001 [Umbelopsis ramanniana AG]KAI8575388.1 hypothetical protein K450DRAFT_262001 [Umbelopsis ramanniana AG]
MLLYVPTTLLTASFRILFVGSELSMTTQSFSLSQHVCHYISPRFRTNSSTGFKNDELVVKYRNL